MTPSAISPPTARAGTSAPATRDAFLAAVRAAELLSPHQQVKASAVARSGSAHDAASALVAAGLLTRFQAEAILAGRTEGFHLGQYIILDQVGRGSMGRVYKAKHRTMNRVVAVKMLAAELTGTTEARRTFQQNVRAAGKLSHPNVVTVYDANELRGRFYLVTEFVDGSNLDEYVRGRGPLPVAEACELVRQVALGLQHAHQHRMVHRDIKPSNLLLNGESRNNFRVKIADFGIDKLSPLHAPAGGLFGTADYLAPELLHNPRATDHRADLYGLGCVFYFLLTGRTPLGGATTQEKVRQHMWDEPPRVEVLRPDVPAAVAAIVHRLMAKYPADRFVSAAEVLAHLEVARICPTTPVGDLDRDPLPGEGGNSNERNALSLDALAGLDIHPTPLGDVSPWARLTDEASESTLALNGDDTPLATPRRPRTSSPHGEPVPMWMTAGLLMGAVLLCIMAIGFVVKVLG